MNLFPSPLCGIAMTRIKRMVRTRGGVAANITRESLGTLPDKCIRTNVITFNTMKTKLIISFYVVLSALVHADEQMIQAAMRYEAKGALDAAAELLQDNLSEGDALEAMPHLIAFVERNLDKLERKNTRGSASNFQQPHVERHESSWWERVAKTTLLNAFTGGSGGWGILPVYAAEKYEEYQASQNEKELAKEMESPSVPSKDEVKEVLAAYDVLRGAVACMEQQVKAGMAEPLMNRFKMHGWRTEERRKH